MAPAYVLRVPRTDEEGAFVLVHTTQVRTKALDMKLVGTDGLAPYTNTIRHSQAASFMVKSCPVSEDEWLSTLGSLLRQELVDDMEIVATVDSESTLVLTFRKRVRGITQRLGTIELKYSPDEEIELYDWCGVSTAACDQARETLASVTAKTSELEETVAQLRRQLDELVEAKKSDEEELLVKFRDLLNEKKVKIREQTALLAAASREANPEPVKFEAVSEDEAPAPKIKSKAKAKPKAAPARKPGTSRAAKRKQPVKDEEETEEEEEAEQMDIDPPAKESPVEVSDEDRNTTDAETETASEGEEEDVPAAPAPAVKLKSPAQPAKPATRARGTRAASKQPDVAPQAATDSAGSTQEAMPPKRELPFGRRRAAPVPAKKATPPPAGDETESDDEL